METKITSVTFTHEDGSTKTFEVEGAYHEFDTSTHEGKGQPPKNTVMRCILMHGISERPEVGLYAQKQ